MLDIELYAGAGGFAVGLGSAGFTPHRLYEVDHACCETLRYNSATAAPTISGVIHEEDICGKDWREFTGRVRILAAGVPCQPFSRAGKGVAAGDERDMFPETMRAIRTVKPQVVIIENVAGLLRPSLREYFDYILLQLECPSMPPRTTSTWRRHHQRLIEHRRSASWDPEYLVQWRLLDAADFGVAQNRRRIIVVATALGLPAYRFPRPSHSREALVRAQADGSYWRERGLPISDRPSSSTQPQEAEGLLPWRTVRDALDGLPEPARAPDSTDMNHWSIPGARPYRGHTASKLDWPSKTLKAGVHGVPGGENTFVDQQGYFRYYTLREAARVQAFPDSHIFVGSRADITRQIGNAVPCTLAEVIAKPLWFCFKTERTTCGANRRAASRPNKAAAR